MRITPDLLEAFLKCPTKCWLRATAQSASGNTYAEWVKEQNETYRAAETDRLARANPARRIHALATSRESESSQVAAGVDVAVAASDFLRSSRGNEAHSSATQPSTIDSQLANQSLVTSAATDEGSASTTTFTVETRLHGVERVPSEGRGKAAQFIPIRFIFRNKLTKDDKLLLAFDALVLSQALGRERQPSAKSSTATTMPRSR